MFSREMSGDLLKNYKAPRTNQITNEIIEVTPELVDMYNQLWFPAELNQAKVILIPKLGKEDYLKANSHLPTSLISVLVKV